MTEQQKRIVKQELSSLSSQIPNFIARISRGGDLRQSAIFGAQSFAAKTVRNPNEPDMAPRLGILVQEAESIVDEFLSERTVGRLDSNFLPTREEDGGDN